MNARVTAAATVWLQATSATGHRHYRAVLNVLQQQQPAAVAILQPSRLQ